MREGGKTETFYVYEEKIISIFKSFSYLLEENGARQIPQAKTDASGGRQGYKYLMRQRT